MPYIAIIVVIIFIFLIFLAVRQNRKMKVKAKLCAVEAAQFHEKLFTDEELHRLKRKYEPLLRTANELYDSPFISNEYLDSFGLGIFMDERKLVNHMQFQNNQNYQT